MMVSSSVPASRFESSGADLSAFDIEPLLADRWVLGLAEMMDHTGVVAGNPECLEKLDVARSRIVDGHAPGLTGRDLCAYVAAGISSDHECTTLEEAREKLRLGMHVMIREGSQARDLDALLPLVRPDTLDRFMFVTDDRDVEDLLAAGHMDHMIRRAIGAGMNPIHAIKLTTLNTARYFGLHDLGMVATGQARVSGDSGGPGRLSRHALLSRRSPGRRGWPVRRSRRRSPPATYPAQLDQRALAGARAVRSVGTTREAVWTCT